MTERKKRLNVGNAVKELREKGYKVEIFHERCTVLGVAEALRLREERIDRLAMPQTVRVDEFRDGDGNIVFTGDHGMSSYGGKTTCVISTKEGVEQARAEAFCSPLDEYVRHTGAIKALGRAFSQLP